MEISSPPVLPLPITAQSGEMSVEAMQERSNDAIEVQCETLNCGSNDHAKGVEATTKEVDTGVGKPTIGMKFGSDESLIAFYNSYARLLGFSIRKNKLRRSERTNLPIARKIVCSKEGFKDMNDKRREGREVKRRRDIREGCQAHIYASVDDDGTWVVRSFQEEHNHVLTSPSKVQKLRSHREISSCAKGLIEKLHGCGLGASKISNVLNASGEQNITSQVCKDQIKLSRKNNIGHECMAVVRCFEDKMTVDNDFFFKVEVDENMTVRSVFWADGRSRSSYLHFGDVVIFDTTYRTNKFLMPFAPFTGINHHRQSTLFGCALLADETTETFIWLFRTWLQCMHGKFPVAIITDQDPAMREAISLIFPTTTHRFCMWHIRKNALIHLHQLRCNKEFEHEYEKWIYGSQSIEEFENRWEDIRTKHNIVEKSWLHNMYELRQMWIHVYLKHVFFAGMSSTQRSESMNSFFDGYVHSQTPLSEFVVQYERAILARREAEEALDFKALNTKASLWSEHPMESQVSTFYTPANFTKFQVEFKKSINCSCLKVAKDDNVVTYEVSIHANQNRKFLVDFFMKERRSTCTCKKFSSEGILCCHVLYILKKKGLQEIPKEYLLPRWSMTTRFVGAKKHNICRDEDKPCLNKLWALRSLHSEMYDWATVDGNSLELALEIAEGGLRKMKEMQATKVPVQPSSVQVESIEESRVSHLDIRDPLCVKAKGRPRKAERIKSGVEVSSSKGEIKKRTCGNCGAKGHYQTTCPEKAT